jgi:hypothetical protein
MPSTRGHPKTGDPMDVAIVHLNDCPHWQTTLDRLRDAMHTLGLDPKRIRLVRAATDQAPADFPGSPTILVDNRDLFPIAISPGPACRRYHTDHGTEGAPSRNAIVSALRQRIRSPGQDSASRRR